MIVGDAAGFVNMSLYKEGTNHAMESGMYAGETVIFAKKKNDFSAKTLVLYEEKLRKGLVLQDLQKYRKLPHILEHTPDLFSLYPKKVANLLIDYFTVSEETKSQLQRRALRNFLKGLPKIRFMRDVIRAKKMC
jgi:electron transfer flavoprotein-quinone oxidoreductase